MSKFFVLDENTLVYTKPGMQGLGVLASSVIKGSNHDPKNGNIAEPMDKSRLRMATWDDFETFRVSPKGHLWDEPGFRKLTHLAGVTTVMRELLEENDELQAMLDAGQPEEACVQFINENW